MNKNVFKIFVLLFAMFCWQNLNAQGNAVQILEKVDDVMNAAHDQEVTVRISIFDRRGNESVRELSMIQKGSDKRMIKFLSPADQKGIAFLSLPNDNLTMYMPAFGRTRKVAGHVRNSKFAGTDYTYEDMEAKRYLDKYNPRLLGADDEAYKLELIPKDLEKSEYSKIHVTVRKSNFYPLIVEYFDKRGTAAKKLTSSDIRKIGEYYIAYRTTMEDLRSGTKTIMQITNVRFDGNLSDDLFTERYLTR
ncbi:MAG: outer membrane lipoprotein-sorting protein [Bacteroidales bacterium]|nr:outer membrane lipoprotein-sorting protein [Bacteroidales bacterium]